MKSSSAARTLKLAWTSSITRQNTCLSCIQRLQRVAPQRSIHSIPLHRHIKGEQIPGFLAEGAYRIAWTEYQQWLIDNLNRLVHGTAEETMTPKDTAIQYAHDANHAAAFNFASMAHNNDFFFKGISQSPAPMSATFKTIVEANFSSVESLHDTMLTMADTMFGPGFVWLVSQKEQGFAKARFLARNRSDPSLAPTKLKLLVTYLAGSPYAAAHWRKQGQDAMTTDFNVRPGETGPQMVARQPGYVGDGFMSQQKPSAYKGNSLLPPAAADVMPLLCVNTWEHAWLPQYGIGGKEEYLERWWDRIEWKIVEENYKRHSS